MSKHKKVLFILSTFIFILGVGCNTTPTTSTINTNNTAVGNINLTNTVVVQNYSNENVNQESDSVVDTSNWKTYTNNEYGFSLRHPEGWDLKVEESPFDSKVINDAKIKGYHWFINNEPIIYIYPEGEFDNDRFLNAFEKELTIAGHLVKQLYLDQAQAYYFIDDPLNNGAKFRIEVYAKTDNDKKIVNELMKLINFDK